MSETLGLRRLEAADWPVVHAWSSRAEFCRFQAWGPNTEEETRAFVTRAGAGEVIVHSARFRMGEISPLGCIRTRGDVVSARRSGVRCCGWIGFEELGLHRIHRIQGTCDPRNLGSAGVRVCGSAGVLGKLGMTYEGRLRHTMLIRDGWRDSEMFSVLEDEWRSRR